MTYAKTVPSRRETTTGGGLPAADSGVAPW